MQRLYRSRQQRVIAGVCGGLADYFRVDVTLVRLAWALIFFAGGTGGALYLLAWLIIPEEGEVASQGKPAERTRAEEPQPVVTPTAEPEERPAPPVLSPGGREGQSDPGTDQATAERNRALGLIMVGLGGLFIVKQFIPWHLVNRLWPLGLVAIGLLIIAGGRGEKR